MCWALLNEEANDLYWHQGSAQVEAYSTWCPGGGCKFCLLSSSCLFRIRLGQKNRCSPVDTGYVATRMSR